MPISTRLPQKTFPFDKQKTFSTNRKQTVNSFAKLKKYSALITRSLGKPSRKSTIFTLKFAALAIRPKRWTSIGFDRMVKDAPRVPKRPARPIRCKYTSADCGHSILTIMFTFSTSIPLAVWNLNKSIKKYFNPFSFQLFTRTSIISKIFLKQTLLIKN